MSNISISPVSEITYTISGLSYGELLYLYGAVGDSSITSVVECLKRNDKPSLPQGINGGSLFNALDKVVV